MENQPFRMISTAIIWVSITAIMIVMSLSQAELNFIIVGILAGAAWFSTDAVWSSGKAETLRRRSVQPSQVREAIQDKGKRDTRVEQLVSSLSQDELRQLRHRLMRDDGELVSMDDLLAEQERGERRASRQ